MPSSGHIRLFLFVFAVLCIAAFVVVLIAEFSSQKWAETVVRVGQELGRLIFTAVGVTFIAVEGGVMLAELYKNTVRKELNAKWQAHEKALIDWMERRDAAVRDGRQFTEQKPQSPA